MFLIVVLCWFYSVSALSVYNNARFEPRNIQFLQNNLTQINSLINCACICFNNSMCLTATYSGINRQCILYLARLDQGTLRVMTTNLITSVLTFKNKTLNPLRLAALDETVYAIWNTTAGRDSLASTFGFGVGDYLFGQGPTQVFDRSSISKYTNFGVCSYMVGFSRTDCGCNTGLFWTNDAYSSADPLNITIEGSNMPSTNLTLGSSWILIYDGTSGLDTDPGRYSSGKTQWLSNNTVWYSSYRLLIKSKRGTGNFVAYSEFELFGYW